MSAINDHLRLIIDAAEELGYDVIRFDVKGSVTVLAWDNHSSTEITVDRGALTGPGTLSKYLSRIPGDRS